jgi:hypothetical protein
MYIDEKQYLKEVECGLDFYSNNNLPSKTISTSIVDFVCINNLAPPIGYSFLFMKNGILYHGFSYGSLWNWNTILDTITSKPINPSIAYKNFNALHVDYIWMQRNGQGYDIFHKRDNKHKYVGVDDFETGKGFILTGYPNPFSKQLSIEVTVEKGNHVPVIEIYDSSSRRIEVLNENNSSGNKYSYTWNAKSRNFPPGLYLVKCKVGQAIVVRKVLYVD